MTQSSGSKQRTFLGHPIGLYFLFFTEMWERFSYYGMRALLVLFMVKELTWSQEESSMVYKWYTSLVYLTPLIGGYLADRFLGNKFAVIIGAILMGLGQFFLASSPNFFYMALVLLILGNGFFKPNMTTQVGRLYAPGDPRRDGAYTIFYMGINLGAFLSPLICGWLSENTIGAYYTGFMAAAIGMVFALVIYLVGLPWIREIVEVDTELANPPSDPLSGVAEEAGAEPRPGHTVPVEVPAAQRETVIPVLNRISPALFAIAGTALALFALPLLGLRVGEANNVRMDWAGGFLDKLPGLDTSIGLLIASITALFSWWIVQAVRGAERDRVLTIYILGFFVVLFWAAFEQAGNALNLWADAFTDRNLTTSLSAPSLYPEIPPDPKDADAARGDTWYRHWIEMWILKERKLEFEDIDADPATKHWWVTIWNPVPTAWFQSINALAIFLLAPGFAALWVWLAKRDKNPATPLKMTLGVFLMGLSFLIMVFAAYREGQPTSLKLQADLPKGLVVNANGQVCIVEKKGESERQVPVQAGRLYFDHESKTLNMRGVMTRLERDRILRETANPDFVKVLEELATKSKLTKPKDFEETVQLTHVPEEFEPRYAGIASAKVQLDAEAKTLTVRHHKIDDKALKGLSVAAADPVFRASLNQLYLESNKHRVSSWWLFWCYIIATLAELCLSPVGLSMVSKLAPARFATMLMGLWLLTSFFGNFAAGAFGESWGTMDPVTYFTIPVVILGVGAVVLFLMSRKVSSMMHGVD